MKSLRTLVLLLLFAPGLGTPSRAFQVVGGRAPALAPPPAPATNPSPAVPPEPERESGVTPVREGVSVGPTRTPKKRRSGREGLTVRRATLPLVTIITGVPDCAVMIDGELKDKWTDEQGRLVIPIEPGPHEVSIFKQDYVTASKDIEVKASPTHGQEARIELSRALLPLKVKTNPPGVRVVLDGSREGVSDAEGLLIFEKVDLGVEHTLRASKEDYAAKIITVPRYSRETETGRLERVMRPLKVKTIPPEADVYLDDEYKGKSDAQGFLDVPKVRAGRAHELRAAKDGYVTTTGTVPPDHEFFPITLPPVLPSPTPTPTPTPTPAPTSTPTPAPAATPTPEPTPAPGTDGSEVNRLVKEGRLARAIEAYALLASSEPQNPSLTGHLDELLRTLNERTSAALARVGPYGLAASVEEARELSELYERVRRWRPGDQRLQALAEYWTAKYWQAGAQTIPSQGGKEIYLKKARAAAQDAGAFNPRDAQVLFDLGSLYVTLGDSDAAVRYFDEARTLDPAWAYPPFALATIEMRAAETTVAKAAKAAHYGRAVEGFTKAITLDPAFRQAYELRCLAYAVVNRHQESVASGQQAVALKPTSAYAHYALGFAYYQLGADKDKKQYRNAINEFNLAITLTDDALDPTTVEGVRQKLAAMEKALGIKP
jgi:tetratricopeptide (TPR) repeat protein